LACGPKLARSAVPRFPAQTLRWFALEGGEGTFFERAHVLTKKIEIDFCRDMCVVKIP